MSSDGDSAVLPPGHCRVGVTEVLEQTPGSKATCKRDYLLDAAKQLHEALERDANEEYEAAFGHYKHGVELLLSGVTVDPSRERREAVKRKISQYLKRAEEIFNCHLQRPLGNVSGAGEGYSSLRFRPIRILSSAVENLKHCTVVAIIDKVQLVFDPSSGNTFVLKSLLKSGRSRHGAVTVIPQCVPFMVPLQRFYISDDALYLQLKHVPGGRLWRQLRKFQAPSTDFPGCFILPSLGPGDTAARPLGPEQGNQSEEETDSASQWACERESDASSTEVPAGGVPEPQVRLWGAQLVLALETLHQEGVLCKDLNPRNLLLGEKGDVCLTYFGQWREVDSPCCSTAAEHLYVAPEVLGVGAVTEACDWWSLGALLYEMLTGQSLSQSLVSGVSSHMRLPLLDNLSSAAVSLLTELLCYDPDRRLGSGPGGVQRIKSHSFFHTVQWNKLL
ncbi:ribosomal protein S6 kinase-like 1 isoform X3 [Ascaphus truei]